MSTIRLTVKGNVEQSRQAMKERGIKGTLVDHSPQYNQTYWDMPDTHIHALCEWFCEPSVCSVESGYPVGTLLHYR